MKVTVKLSASREARPPQKSPNPYTHAAAAANTISMPHG
jgi:hypothetical protein